MQVEWYGQSAFRLTDGATTVFIDPFDDMTPLAERGLRWEYPAIEGVEADLVLVTHEHRDHNGVEAIAGEPVTLRSTAGRLESPIGEVLAVASEHDDAAGTERGPNTEPVDAFAALAERVERPESSAVDLEAVPSGDGPVVVVPSAP
jgi:L-ascorbate metabolism protein UlaG (beta-lactamase superfamily)